MEDIQQGGTPHQKPKHLTAENGRAFRLESVAAHYRYRPPYPEALVERLRTGGAVLEMGCGTGEMSRRLAPAAARVVGVDPSPAMLAEAPRQPGGDAANVTWIESSAEAFETDEKFDLILTPQSLHWMTWEVVLPRFARWLAPGGRLAVIPTCRFEETPWRSELMPLIRAYSAMQDFEPYDLIDEIETRGLFRADERGWVGPEPWRQSVDDYVLSWKSRAGLAWERVGADRAEEFASRVRRLVEPHARDDWLEFGVVAELAIGTPEANPASPPARASS